jgi:hypothetical protein
VLVLCGVTLALIAVAPVIVLVGEPLRRYCVRRRRLAVVVANPVLIALTAPERWAIDQVRELSSGGGFGWFGRRGGNWPPPAGVREPRRPKPGAPAGAIALAEPRQELRVIRILKAFPPALSKRLRRARSILAEITGAIRPRRA